MKNYSKGIPYHTQRNNLEIPYSSCNTTSVVMALKQAGYACDWGKGQPEDILTRLLLSQKYQDMMDEINPEYRHMGYLPNEIHACLCAATNEIIGHEVSIFSTETSLEDIKNNIYAGGGVVLSGIFRDENGKKLYHIVSLAGIDKDGAIIDDPFGNPLFKYTNHQGNDIYLTIDQFRSFMKGSGNLYWAHLIKPIKKVA